jgi:hypothetical protein
MNRETLLELPFIELEKIVNEMSLIERNSLCRELEILSARAGEMAAYLDERYGGGCGDQGHQSAVKNLNKAGRIIWTKAFGYNAYRDLSF